jgi:hypothetical protein
MKLENILQEQVLLELSDKLKHNDSYGTWIDTNLMKIHRIPQQGGHVDFILSRLHQWGIPETAIKKAEDYYTVGFSKGLVRTVHRPRFEIGVDGLKNDLKKIVPVIMATALQPDIKYVNVNKIMRLGDPGTSQKTFEMPGQRNELQFYLKS